ncbi:DUF6282 family protein [Streptomyces cinnamoneus]|uniref:Uncharacterized protein n=1 Tax=Streptomyces cinnamoneus TaxID=53446 RepID=A0A918U366_STRCJ|nr:DUF6282 family protein [Streptomyces cinnamoneus]GHC70384.1 hypothetical protein GCM10010507_56550 [Streptomyces cinnamoneus]
MPDLSGGVVDVHYHAGPDLYERRLTSCRAARAYAAVGGWVVVKSHLGSTASRAWEAREAGLPVSGAVVLNDLAGGVRAQVVEQSVYEHGPDSPARLVVHLPTLTEPGHPATALRRRPFHPRLTADAWLGARVLDDEGRLRKEVSEVLRAARDLPVAIATGHCNREEALRVVDEAVRLGVPRVLLTHATHPMSGFTPADLADLAEPDCVYVELTALTRLLGHHDAEQFRTVLHAHPRIVYSSDLGQLDQPGVAEWLVMSADWFAEAGLTEERIKEVTSTNPARLLAP